MTFEEEHEPSTLTTQHHHHHLMDWLENSITFLPSFLDEPYAVPAPNDMASYEWWGPDLDPAHLNSTPTVSVGPDNPTTTTTTTTTTTPTDSPRLPLQPEFSKKRKDHTHRQRITAENGDDGDGEQEDEGNVQRKPGKKNAGKGGGGSSTNGGSKEMRWAEQLLNTCAAAIDGGNLSRVQHLLYVLQELASPSGDVNHRLAAHGLRELAHHLSAGGAAVSVPAAPAAPAFATTEARFFRSALIRFHEVSPWFAFHNALANASILHVIGHHRGLHVVDIGISHGVQWPTLLEAMTRRPGGAPPLVRLTDAGSAAPPAPFSQAPPGYDFPSHLLRYANSINLNLTIDEADAVSAAVGSGDEVLVVCIQFRTVSDEALRSVREMAPDLVVLTGIDGGGREGGEGFAAGFGRRAEMVWRFLESTSAAFKGKDCGERRVMEGEAAGMAAAAAEGREKWKERMVAAGFREEEFREEAVDAGRALLRKYDGNWEMRQAAPPPAAEVAAVGLWWKGQPVSFCSLWRPVVKPAGAINGNGPL